MTNEYRSLYEEIIVTMTDGKLDQAGAKIEQVLQADPENSEALLCWCELLCARGRTDEGIVKARALLKKQPNNPYFLLAHTQLLMHKAGLGEVELSVSQVEQMLRTAYDAANSYDELAKVGLVCCRNGFWSLGTRAFMDASISKPLPNDFQLMIPDLAGVEECLEECKQMDMAPNLKQVPIGIAVRTYFLLLQANDAGIPEAWLAAIALAREHQAFTNIIDQPAIMPNLFDRYCKDRWFSPEGAPSETLAKLR